MSSTQITSSPKSLPRDLHQLAARLAATGRAFAITVQTSLNGTVSVVASWPNDVALPDEIPHPTEQALVEVERLRQDSENARLDAEREHEQEVDALQARISDLTAQIAALHGLEARG